MRTAAGARVWRGSVALAIACVSAVLGATARQAAGETRPVRAYTTAQGLASDYAGRVRRDSRGFLWIGTNEGLSRFDGAEFVTYTTADGLPDPVVNDVLEDSRGRLWIATNGGGVALFQPDRPASRPASPTTASLETVAATGGAGSSRALFQPRPVGTARDTNRVNVLVEHDGRIWAGTDAGLFAIALSAGDDAVFAPVPLGLPYLDRAVRVNAIARGRDADFWLATSVGVVRRTRDGAAVYFGAAAGLPPLDAVAIHVDGAGLVWSVEPHGIVVRWPSRLDWQSPPPTGACAILPSGAPHPPAANPHACVAVSIGDRTIGALRSIVDAPTAHADGKERVLIAGTLGIAELTPIGLRPVIRFPSARGLVSADTDGSFWVGSSTDGLQHYPHAPLVAFDMDDGFEPGQVTQFLQDEAGRLVAVSPGWTTHRRERGRFTAYRLPRDRSWASAGWGDPLLRTRAGEWWAASARGLVRFASQPLDRLPHARPSATYTRRDGLAGERVVRLFEDSTGAIWIASLPDFGDALARYDPATKTFVRFTQSDGMPRFNLPLAFAEDRAGQIWIGLREGGLLRYRAGRFTLFGPAEGIIGVVRLLFVDAGGRLWLATTAGALRIEDPRATPFRTTRYTRQEGLRADGVFCFAEGRDGRMFIGHAQGVDILSPDGALAGALGRSDGLPASHLISAATDGDGAVWFGTVSGLARLVPVPDPPAETPATLIGTVTIDGVRQPLAEIGTRRVEEIALRAGAHQIEIRFFGLVRDGAHALRYQYRLGARDDEWTRPSAARSVTYAGLASGRHRFEVRALGARGTIGDAAVVDLRVLRPWWQRWYVLLSAIAGAALVTYAIYRHRLAQLLQVERVRTRIASDLHDDIGAGLSQIAILAEVARRQPADDQLHPRLGKIASTSTALVDSMNDIVWAINPRRDSLRDLVHRMRRFTEDTLGGAGIAYDFRAPDDTVERKLGADVRRDLLLILKEGVTNVARHSGAANASIACTPDANSITLEIRDDGRGFDESVPPEGNGLHNMQKRARARGGALTIETSAGGGTTIRVALPLRTRG